MTIKPSTCIVFALLAITFANTTLARSGETNEQKTVISIEQIWDRPAHAAFTDLIRFNDSLYCAFREGSGHVAGINGTIRVIRSRDGINWESVTLLDEPHVDLRDPKLSITPDGRLMLSMGASYYHGKNRIAIESRSSFSNEQGEQFSEPTKVILPEDLKTGFDWLWRVTWRQNTAYGCVQQLPKDKQRRLSLVKSEDGVHWQPVAKLDIGTDPTETTIRFLPDGTMLAMARAVQHQEPGRIGIAKPPYTDWTFRKSNHAFGGPNLIELPNGAWLAGGRDQTNKPYRTRLWILDPNTADLQTIITLPSDGDNSYPGFVVDPSNDRLYVSYYSSHEGKTAIYLATLRLNALMNQAK